MTKFWCTFNTTFVVGTIFTACSPELTASAEISLKRHGNLRVLQGDSPLNESNASNRTSSRKDSELSVNASSIPAEAASNLKLFPCNKAGGIRGPPESTIVPSTSKEGFTSNAVMNAKVSEASIMDAVGSFKHGSSSASLTSSLAQTGAITTTTATSRSTNVAASTLSSTSTTLFSQVASMIKVRHSSTNTTITSTSTRNSINGTTSIVICVGEKKCIENTGSSVISSSPISSSLPTVVPGFAPSMQPTVSSVPIPVTAKPTKEVAGIIPTATTSPTSRSTLIIVPSFAPVPLPRSSSPMRQRPAKDALGIITLTPTVSSSPVPLCTPFQSKGKLKLPPSASPKSTGKRKKKRSPSTPTKSKSKSADDNTTMNGFSVQAILSDHSIPVTIGNNVSCCAQELPIHDTKYTEHPQALSHGSLFANNSMSLPTTIEGSNDVKSNVIVGSDRKFGVINGTVFQDRNSNGKQDNGEVGMERCGVQIFDTSNSTSTNTPMHEVVTDRKGFYQFDQLPLNRVYTILPDLNSFDHSNYISVTTGVFSPVQLTELHRTAQNDIGINDGNAITYFGPSGLVEVATTYNDDDDEA